MKSKFQGGFQRKVWIPPNEDDKADVTLVVAAFPSAAIKYLALFKQNDQSNCYCPIVKKLKNLLYFICDLHAASMRHSCASACCV